jgi:hypothetical protein
MRRRWFAFRNWWLYEVSGVNRATFILEVLGILAVLFYTRISAKQWNAMVNANEIAQRNLATTNRPYLTVYSITPREKFAVGNTYDPVVCYRNAGHTEARDVEYDPWTGIVPPQRASNELDRLLKNPDWCGAVKGFGLIAPDTTRCFDVDDSRNQMFPSNNIGFPLPRLRQSQYDVVQNDTEHWYIIAMMSYRDQFGYCHRDIEPWVWNPIAGCFSPYAGGFHENDEKEEK